MLDMFSYSKAAMERMMKVQEVLLRAMARKITWFQAAEILGFTDRFALLPRAGGTFPLSPYGNFSCGSSYPRKRLAAKAEDAKR